MSNDHLSELMSLLMEEKKCVDKRFAEIDVISARAEADLHKALGNIDAKLDYSFGEFDFDWGTETKELEESMQYMYDGDSRTQPKKKSKGVSALGKVFTEEGLSGRDIFNLPKPDLALPVKPEPPIVGLSIGLVWIKYQWNKLLGRDIIAKSLYDAYIYYQDNKADVINRYVTIKRSKLGNQYGLSPLSTISGKWFISDYWSFMPFKPVLDHFIWKAINSNDFSHPLLAGLFDKRHSTKERTACFNMVVNYWDDISESHQYSIINKVNENRRTASAETKQEIEDLLEILKVVY